MVSSRCLTNLVLCEEGAHGDTGPSVGVRLTWCCVRKVATRGYRASNRCLTNLVLCKEGAHTGYMVSSRCLTNLVLCEEGGHTGIHGLQSVFD